MYVCCECSVWCSAPGESLVQRNPTDCGVSESDREALIVRRPWPTTGCCAMGGKKCFAGTTMCSLHYSFRFKV
jgi:hypothetical protein